MREIIENKTFDEERALYNSDGLLLRFEFLGAAVSTPLSWLGAMVPVAVAYIIAAQELRRKAIEE